MAIVWNDIFKLNPPNKDTPQRIASKHRELIEAIENRIKNEHKNGVDSTSDGTEAADWLHKAGSAVCYIDDYGGVDSFSGPTTRPDGVTALDSNDAGRICIDKNDNTFYGWDGSAWQKLTKVEFDESATFNAKVTFNDDIVQAWGKKGIFSRPAVTAGSNTYLKRSDGLATHTILGGTSSPNTIFTFATPAAMAPSVVRASFICGEGAGMGVKYGSLYATIRKNGVVVTSAITGSRDVSTVLTADVSVVGGDQITFTVSGDGVDESGDCQTRYRRIGVAESITLTEWEKAYFGFTG